MAMIIVAQAKDRLYHNWNLEDVFFPFAIIVFGCFHEYVDANMVWSTKGYKSYPLLVL
jgi:hypothetical protein